MASDVPPDNRKDLLTQIQSSRKKEEKTRLGYDSLTYNKLANYNLRKESIVKQILREHPDLELGIEINVSSIVSPIDMITSTFVTTIEKSFLPPEIKRNIIDMIEEDLNSFYSLKDDLYDIVYAAFDPGAYCAVCINNNMIKETLNGVDKEDDSVRVMSYKTKDIKVCDNDITKLITITNNPNVLNVSKNSIEVLSSTMDKEDSIKSNREKLETLRELIDLSNIHGNGGDRPIFMSWPTSSVIPITLPHDPSNHIKYILLLDNNGFPLNVREELIHEEIKEKPMLELARSTSSGEKSKKAILATKENSPLLNNSSELALEVIDERVKSLITNNGLGGIINDSEMNTLKQVLLSRILKNHTTNMLILPASSVSYFSFAYRENGMGKSPIEDLNIIASIRSMLRFSTLSALVQNATQITKAKVKLDEDDADVDMRVQEAYDFIYNSREDSVPIGLLDIGDISDWLKRVGVVIEFEHETLPNLQYDLERIDTDKKVPDGELDEKMAKVMYNKIHLTPEMIDSSTDIDFAETIKTSNVLFTRRMIRKQKPVNKFLSKFAKMVLDNDGVLENNIKELLRSDIKSINKKIQKGSDKIAQGFSKFTDEMLVDLYYLDIKDNIKIEIPRVETTEENINSEAFQTFVTTIDEILETVVSSDMLPADFVGETGDMMDEIKEMLKVSIVRRWLSNNGYFKDTLKLFETESGRTTMPLLDEYKDYADKFNESLGLFFKDIKRTRKKGDRLVEKFSKDEISEEASTPEKI